MTIRWRRVGRMFAVMAAGVALLGGGWALSQVVLAAPEPEPVYRPSDLPPAPPAASNGWQAFRAAGGPGVNVPPALALVPSGGDASGEWAHVQREAAPLRAFVGSAPVQASLRAYEDALDRPHFADACAVRLAESCPVLPVFRAHRLEELSLLVRSLDDRQDEAAQGLARLITADASWLGSARSLISFEVAVAGARRALSVATMLAPRFTPDGKAAVAAAIERLRSTRADLERPLAVEYLLNLEAIDLVAGDAGALVSMGPHSPGVIDRVSGALFVDRGQTRQLLADRTRAWQAWLAQPPTTPTPSDRLFSDRPLSWLHNPVGKRTLDMLQLSASIWPKARLEAEALAREVESVRASLSPG